MKFVGGTSNAKVGNLPMRNRCEWEDMYESRVQPCHPLETVHPYCRSDDNDGRIQDQHVKNNILQC